MADPATLIGLKMASRREARGSDSISESQRPYDEETEISTATAITVPPQQQTLATSSATDDVSIRSSKRSAAADGPLDGLSNQLQTDSSSEVRGLEKRKTSSEGFFKKCAPKEPFTVRNQIERTLLGSWLNVLLVAVPVGIALDQIESVSRVAVFVVNFIAIIPLAAMLGLATEEIALRTGETVGGLLNATFGNAVELIVAILALAEGKVTIVQTSLIGSILSNLLLVLGMCFFCGGIRRPFQNFNTTVAQTAASLLALAVASVIIPTVFDHNTETSVRDVAQLSRGTSVILLVVYGAYLFFQLKTHQTVFMAKSEKVPKRQRTPKSQKSTKGIGGALPGMTQLANGGGQPNDLDGMRQLMLNRRMHASARMAENEEEEDGEEVPILHFGVAAGLLVGVTVIIAFCAEFLVSSIDAVTAEGSGIREEFVGLILLPIVGNAAEHATAITVAMKDKMDLAIGVAVGSSMQVALFLIPLLVMIGWGMGMDEMNLSFDLFQVAVLFVSVLLCNYLIADGKSHWLEGMLLICLYAIIATCTFWYPDKEVTGAE